MAVKKWSWSAENPPKFKRSRPGVFFNASQVQVEKAYYALKNNGAVSDFSSKVWNDLCGKIKDQNLEWGMNDSFGWYNDEPFVWVTSPNREDYQSDEGYEFVLNHYGKYIGSMSSDKINMVADALLPMPSMPRPWLKELGRPDIKKGDDCIGEYFLWIVNALNYWISLSPSFIMSNSGNMKHLTTARMESSNAISMLRNIMVIVHADSVKGELYRPYPFYINDHLSDHDSVLKVVKVPSMPASSPFNFHTLEIRCTAAVMDKSEGVLISDEFKLLINTRIENAISACISSVDKLTYGSTTGMEMIYSIASHIYDAFVLNENAAADLSDSVWFAITDEFLSSSSMQLRKLRPVHATAFSDYIYRDQLSLLLRSGSPMSHTGTISTYDSFKIQTTKENGLMDTPDTIFVKGSSSIDSSAAENAQHSGKIRETGAFLIDEVPSFPLLAECEERFSQVGTLDSDKPLRLEIENVVTVRHDAVLLKDGLHSFAVAESEIKMVRGESLLATTTSSRIESIAKSIVSNKGEMRTVGSSVATAIDNTDVIVEKIPAIIRRANPCKGIDATGINISGGINIVSNSHARPVESHSTDNVGSDSTMLGRRVLPSSGAVGIISTNIRANMENADLNDVSASGNICVKQAGAILSPLKSSHVTVGSIIKVGPHAVIANRDPKNVTSEPVIELDEEATLEFVETTLVYAEEIDNKAVSEIGNTSVKELERKFIF